MFNQIILIGRIAQDVEQRAFEDGKRKSIISLAVQRPFKNMEGGYDVDFIKVSVWDQLAHYIEGFAQKGVMIAVKGRLQTWIYEENDKKIQMLEVMAERITYLTTPQNKKQAFSEALD